LKGLLGNFRANHSMVFYNNRSDVDPTMPASISNPSDAGKSGYLTNFKPYWDFKSIMQGVPIRFMSANNPDWVWNNQSTRFNAKGLELETQNALKIFTAAQYGFNKTLPIAITNNSQYNESFYEGFEDFGFDNSLKTSNSGICIEDKHIDFSSFPNTDAQIINTDNKNFSAHTGKYVLGVANNTTVSKQIAVNSPVPLDYNLQFGTGILTTLTDLGGNATLDNPNPNPNNNESPAWTFEPNFNESPSPIARVKVVPKDKSTKVPCSGNLCDGYSHSYGISFDSYINITESREYNFEIDFSTSYGSSSAQVYSNSLTVSIADLNGTTYSSESISKSVFNSQNMQKMYTVFLCKGIYHIVGKGDERYVSLQSSGGTENWYYWRCTNANTPNYKSLNTQTGCHYTMAVAGSEDMMHPTFSLPSSKQMLLSAWVKEDCGDPSQGIPCRQSTYSGNEINIQFNNGQSQPLNFKPSGPIIEGWQRYESMFTVPTGASTATLSLVNNTDKWIYFDDIRIHPYKANMKSFVYDPVSMRLVAQLDENNYASYYEYDEDGTLIRTKAETKDGVKTLNETRSSKQTTINTVQ
ncbi:MAG TPA: hypothetical protein VNS32_22205, partial [Flavisolibacter sp.]|nr:hypothetical protein [Flavisolibacter sp.]